MTDKYYKTKESVEEYIKMAKDVDSRQLIEKLKRHLPAESLILEIGSGPGTDWNILSESYSVVGSDNSAEFLKHLNAENPAGEFLELDATSLKTDKIFDGIYANKVMHHLNDDELKASIKRHHEILNPEGIVCHSYWKGEGTEVFKGLFVNYHNEAGIKEFYKDSFEILLLESYKEFEEGDSLVLIGKRR